MWAAWAGYERIYPVYIALIIIIIIYGTLINLMGGKNHERNALNYCNCKHVTWAKYCSKLLSLVAGI